MFVNYVNVKANHIGLNEKLEKFVIFVMKNFQLERNYLSMFQV